ncbi:DUF7311 family protein [Haloarcula marina]|uniref:DUF7311 family protein n=1 Tax=Haloarcula marina TaxID=2961574 RepID=UPI0020B6C840|nr:hypothetical protein [Halomicroarcula marina]
MIVRLVVGTVLAATLLGVAAQPLSTARADAADAAVDRQVTALGERLQSMVATDDPTRGRGARRVAEIRLPARTWTSAAVRRLRFHTREGVGVASWRVGGATNRTKRLVGVQIRPVGEALTLRESGTHRLAFGYRRQSGAPVVTVRHVGRQRGDGEVQADAS